MKSGRHSKPSNKRGILKQGKSRTQANIAGYEKRLARKAKSTPTTDLYEHIPEKTRRSKVALDVGRDEEFEFPNTWEGADDKEREELRARLIGENEDDEEIASGDDEEIDSDAAFEETDEERFAGFFSAKKSVEEEEEEGDDNEFIDLLDVLDGKGEIDMGSDSEKPSDHPAEKPSLKIDDETDEDEGVAENSEQDSGSDSDSAFEEKLDFDPSDDEEMPEALDQLNEFVSNLDVTSKKRKATEEPNEAGPNTDTRARKRRLVKERTEAGAENEFRARSSGSKLNIDDLLAPLASQSSALQSLKTSAKVLVSSSSKAKTLSAPLPQRTQERLDRQAAYEQTKEEVDKWSETMKHIREAEHLSFPLQSQSAGRVSNLELTAKFKPTTPLETAVDALLKSAKLRDEDILQNEEAILQMNQVSVEEIARRRGELRKMRELMFRAEIKARRVGKIKSKTYRRIKRKEKERLGEKINEDDSEDEEGMLKKELERARERATLRHKHTGKWARQMRNKEGLDADSRRDIEDMLARGEKLRRRIKGVGSDESEGSEDESDDDDGLDGEAGLAKIKQGAFDELRKLGEAERPEGDENQKGRSVFEMKFMKDAMARQMQATNKTMDDFIKEMGDNIGTGDSDGEEQENGSQVLDLSDGVLVQRTGGRVTYRPSETTHNPSTRPPAASDTSSVTLKSTDLLTSPPPSPELNLNLNRQSAFSAPSTQDSNSNPWLTRATEAIVKLTKKTNEVVVEKDSKSSDKSKNKLKKQARKKEEERKRAKEDEVVEISLDKVLTLPSGPSGSSPPELAQKADRKASQQTSVVHADENDSDSNSEVEAQETAVTLKGKGKANGIKAFEQRDLVALAFAGDNVVQNFEEAKSREIASDAPREVDTTIPGWGSWGGTGIRKLPPKPQRIKKIAGIDPTTRADFNKKNIIISEKRDKKAGKYLVKDLPYPYTSKAQFERAMENPLGSEWNTRVAFQRGTLPKVVKKPGVIINPLEKLTS